MDDSTHNYWIFIDNSNLFIEGQKFYAAKNNWLVRIDPRFKIDFGKLINCIVSDAKKVKNVYLYGSEPPAMDTLWYQMEEIGIEVNRFKRNVKKKEKAIDVALAVDATKCASDQKEKRMSGTFVFVTGDRDISPVIKVVIDEGFKVLVVSYKSALSNNISSINGIDVNYLDDIFMNCCNLCLKRKYNYKISNSITIVLTKPLKEDQIKEITSQAAKVFRLPCMFKLKDARVQGDSLLILIFVPYSKPDSGEYNFGDLYKRHSVELKQCIYTIVGFDQTFVKEIVDSVCFKNRISDFYFASLMSYFKEITETDSLRLLKKVNSEKIKKFVRELIKYINKSIFTNILQVNPNELLLGLVKAIFKSEFIEYYLNDSNSKPKILEKYIQSKPPVLSHCEEIRKYGCTQLYKSICIGKIKPEFTSLLLWNDLLKETLSCFQTIFSKKNANKHNFFASFGSLPERNIECCLFVSTGYLTEWFTDFLPSPINLLPVVFIYDKVSLLKGPKTFEYHNELSIGISVGGNGSKRSGTLTCFLQETKSKDIFALVPAHVAFKTNGDYTMSDEMSNQLIQPGNSEKTKLDENQTQTRSIGLKYDYKYGNVIDGFTIDAALFKVKLDNRKIKIPINSFAKPFTAETRTETRLQGINDIERNDDETEYFIFGKQTRYWCRGFMNKCPYYAKFEGDDHFGLMYFSTRDPFSAPLCALGDSGGIVINEASELVGMVIGGCNETGAALVTPIKTILKSFSDLNLTLYND